MEGVGVTSSCEAIGRRTGVTLQRWGIDTVPSSSEDPSETAASSPSDLLALADWRRRIAECYASVRTDPDPERAWNAWCATRRELFRTHPQSPVPDRERASYDGPFHHPYDPTARVLASVQPAEPARLEITTSDGNTTPFLRFGVATFEFAGHAATLALLWLDAYGGGIYLAFRDASSGTTTYGGGRYLLDTVKGADLGAHDGQLVLDFNFAYQPSCSYDARWSCPLPPPENRLPFAVNAGERLAAGG
jgi:uncharacterized protein